MRGETISQQRYLIIATAPHSLTTNVGTHLRYDVYIGGGDRGKSWNSSSGRRAGGGVTPTVGVRASLHP